MYGKQDPRNMLDQNRAERGQTLKAISWETKRMLHVFLALFLRNSTKRGISIIDPIRNH